VQKYRKTPPPRLRLCRGFRHFDFSLYSLSSHQVFLVSCAALARPVCYRLALVWHRTIFMPPTVLLPLLFVSLHRAPMCHPASTLLCARPYPTPSVFPYPTHAPHAIRTPRLMLIHRDTNARSVAGRRSSTGPTVVYLLSVRHAPPTARIPHGPPPAPRFVPLIEQSSCIVHSIMCRPSYIHSPHCPAFTFPRRHRIRVRAHLLYAHIFTVRFWTISPYTPTSGLDIQDLLV
jgi:hypothetical protein